MFDNLALNEGEKKGNDFIYCEAFLLVCFWFYIVQVPVCAQLAVYPCQDLLQKIKIFARLAFTTAAMTMAMHLFLCALYASE